MNYKRHNVCTQGCVFYTVPWSVVWWRSVHTEWARQPAELPLRCPTTPGTEVGSSKLSEHQ